MNVTVSGSFRRHMASVAAAVSAFKSIGAAVLSPSDPEIVDQVGGFVFVASDNYRSIRAVQDRHFYAIEHSDFLWLETPNGYVGNSATLEIGFAKAVKCPVYSNCGNISLHVRDLVTVTPSLPQMRDRVKPSNRRFFRNQRSFLKSELENLLLSGRGFVHPISLARAVTLAMTASHVPTVENIPSPPFVIQDAPLSDDAICEIARSSFVWLDQFDIDPSPHQILQLGAAIALRKVIFAAKRPLDLTLSEYVPHMASTRDRAVDAFIQIANMRDPKPPSETAEVILSAFDASTIQNPMSSIQKLTCRQPTQTRPH